MIVCSSYLNISFVLFGLAGGRESIFSSERQVFMVRSLLMMMNFRESDGEAYRLNKVYLVWQKVLSDAELNLDLLMVKLKQAMKPKFKTNWHGFWEDNQGELFGKSLKHVTSRIILSSSLAQNSIINFA